MPVQAVAVTILSCLAQDVALVPVLRPAYPDVFALLAQLRVSLPSLSTEET